MTRYEYKTEECASLEDLNRFGAEGWEFLGQFDVLVPDEEEPGEETAESRILFRREIPHPYE